MTVMMMRRENKGVMVMMEAMMRRVMKVQRVLRKRRRSAVIRGWNTIQG
jgi:hypothetical protein